MKCSIGKLGPRKRSSKKIRGRHFGLIQYLFPWDLKSVPPLQYGGKLTTLSLTTGFISDNHHH